MYVENKYKNFLPTLVNQEFLFYPGFENVLFRQKEFVTNLLGQIQNGRLPTIEVFFGKHIGSQGNI